MWISSILDHIIKALHFLIGGFFCVTIKINPNTYLYIRLSRCLYGWTGHVNLFMHSRWFISHNLELSYFTFLALLWSLLWWVKLLGLFHNLIHGVLNLTNNGMMLVKLLLYFLKFWFKCCPFILKLLKRQHSPAMFIWEYLFHHC